MATLAACHGPSTPPATLSTAGGAPAPGAVPVNTTQDSHSAPGVVANNTSRGTPTGTGSIEPTGPVAAPPPIVTGGSSGGGGATEILPAAALTGKVKLPSSLVSNNGGSIVSNNGSSLISDNGGALIGKTRSAGIVANNTSRGYGLLDAAPTESVLTDAFLYLTDRDEKFYVDRAAHLPFAATTDGQGRYAFPLSTAFPYDQDVVVNAVISGNLRLTGYMRPGPVGATLDVDLATTLATEYLRGAAVGPPARLLSSYDRAGFEAAIAQTRLAIQSGDIPAVESVPDELGHPTPVGTFDLRIDRVYNLRNQYAAALAAVDFDNAVVKRLSDLWKTLLGYRPEVVTSILGNGDQPVVTSGLNGSRPRFGFASGNHVAGQPDLPPTSIAAGYVNAATVSRRGDVFIASYTDAPHSGHIRWIRPDGTVTSVWLPNRYLLQPYSLKVEREPVDDVTSQAPGTLIVLDNAAQRLFRVPIVDVNQVDASFLDPVTGLAKPAYQTQVVAGETGPQDPDDTLDPQHPLVVDAASPPADVDSTDPARSRYRLSDEGERRYATTGALVPNPARYAYLNSPTDVALDELGNIYIADHANHRVRMIPSADGRYYNYQTPQDPNHDGIPDAFSGAETMKAGCLYTIAGDPQWDPARTPDDGAGRWFGEFAGDGGPAQLAHLDQPLSLAYHDGYLYLDDFDNQRIRRISRATGLIETVVGAPAGPQRDNGGGDFDYAPGSDGGGGPAAQAQLAYVQNITFDSRGRLIIADNSSGRIRMVDTDGIIKTIAGRLQPLDGSGSSDNSTDGDALTWADLYGNYCVSVDPHDNVVFVDGRHNRVRKLWRQWD